MKNMKLKYLVGAVIVAVAGTFSYATDAVTGNGASRTVAISRWNTAQVLATSSNLSVSLTNIISTVPSVVGKVWFSCGNTGDVLVIHSAKTVAQANRTNSIFKVTATSQTVDVPFLYDLTPGQDATNGVVVVIQSAGTTTNLSRAWINWDNVE